MKNESSISSWHPASLICTCYSVGKIPFAPGTWGTLFGVALLYFYTSLSFIAIVPLFFLGWWCSNIYEKNSGKHDAKEIVIDEVVGVFLTAFIAIPFSEGVDTLVFFLTVFITFRIFDIVKRGPVGWVDRNVKGGLGVMLDDVVAGVLAGITSALIFMLL